MIYISKVWEHCVLSHVCLIWETLVYLPDESQNWGRKAVSLHVALTMFY